MGLACIAMAIPAQERPPDGHRRTASNAADVYRLAIEEAQRAFVNRGGTLLNLPHRARREDLRGEFWRATTTKAGTAITLFHQASPLARCSFALLPNGDTELATMAPLLAQLRELVFADGWQRCETQPAASISAAQCLLAHARHLLGASSRQGIALGYLAEQRATELITETLANAGVERAGRLRARCAELLDDHFERRVKPRQIADALREECRRKLVAASLFARTNVTAQELDELLQRVFEPIPDDPNESIALPADVVDARADTLRSQLAGRKNEGAPPDLRCLGNVAFALRMHEHQLTILTACRDQTR